MMDSDSDDKMSEVLEQELYSASTLHSLGLSEEVLRGIQPSGTLALELIKAQKLVTAGGWGRTVIARHDFGFSLPRQTRHSQSAQLKRRGVLARSRNHLLSLALKDEDWVLWLDSDLKWYPGDIIEKLLEAAGAFTRGSSLRAGMQPAQQQQHDPQFLKQILVPNCVLSLGGGRSYDLNSWRGGLSPGNNASLKEVVAYHDRVASKGLTLEGYGPTGAHYLNHFRLKGSEHHNNNKKLEGRGGGTTSRVWIEEEEDMGDITPVRLDAVGGAMLLVHAELHRHGLVFPPFPFRGRIETEGLSMMALDMGVLSWGLPFLEVLHV